MIAHETINIKQLKPYTTKEVVIATNKLYLLFGVLSTPV